MSKVWKFFNNRLAIRIEIAYTEEVMQFSTPFFSVFVSDISEQEVALIFGVLCFSFEIWFGDVTELT